MQTKLNGTGTKRIYRAFVCSINGFKAAFKYESAFRQELLLCVILFPVSFVISNSIMQWGFLIVTLILLLIVEVINSAIEALADKITTEHDQLIGRAKDLGSTAVFLAITIICIVWSSTIYYYFTSQP